jgi:hypothetical protein
MIREATIEKAMRDERGLWSGTCGYQSDDELLSLALGNDCISISPSALRPQSILGITERLVLLHALTCTQGYMMQARALLTLLQFKSKPDQCTFSVL